MELRWPWLFGGRLRQRDPSLSCGGAGLPVRAGSGRAEPARMAAAAGNLHSAAVGEDGALFVWGRGRFGQLGTGDSVERLAPTPVDGMPA
ncbi:MAG: hypothetical protein ACPIOQ_85180, partial [Promethearchaeia archaeon]